MKLEDLANARRELEQIGFMHGMPVTMLRQLKAGPKCAVRGLDVSIRRDEDADFVVPVFIEVPK